MKKMACKFETMLDAGMLTDAGEQNGYYLYEGVYTSIVYSVKYNEDGEIVDIFHD